MLVAISAFQERISAIFIQSSGPSGLLSRMRMLPKAERTSDLPNEIHPKGLTPDAARLTATISWESVCASSGVVTP